MPSKVKKLHKDLNALGNSAVNKPLYRRKKVDKTLLERFPSPFAVDNKCGAEGIVDLSFPEFSSLCPKTGQPDSANILIKYRPGKWCVESKSIKLYFFSYRNHGCFMEAIVNQICNDLVELLEPEWLEVVGKFAARGGIPIEPRATYTKSHVF